MKSLKRERIAGLAEEEQFRLAKERCVLLLTYCDRTEKQLCERLVREGYPARIAERAVSWAESMHYADDSRYARQYIEGKAGSRGLARIRAELKVRGISEHEADLLLEEYGSREEQGAAVMARKLSSGKNLKDPAVFRKVLQAMLRRGFPLELSRKMLCLEAGSEDWDSC